MPSYCTDTIQFLCIVCLILCSSYVQCVGYYWCCAVPVYSLETSHTTRHWSLLSIDPYICRFEARHLFYMTHILYLQIWSMASILIHMLIYSFMSTLVCQANWSYLLWLSAEPVGLHVYFGCVSWVGLPVRFGCHSCPLWLSVELVFMCTMVVSWAGLYVYCDCQLSWSLCPLYLSAKLV